MTIPDEIADHALRLCAALARRGMDRRTFLGTFAAQLSSRTAAVWASGSENQTDALRPVCGVSGYTLALQFTFGTSGKVKSIADLEALFMHDPLGAALMESCNPSSRSMCNNHVFEADSLALTGIADGSGVYNAWGHITSGALLTKATCFAPCIVEIIARLPAGRGVWPSLYLYDEHSGHHDSSEIDIMESQFNAPIGIRDDRSCIFQFDHGPGVGATVSSSMNRWGRWQPYGPIPDGDMSARWAAYSVLWLPDRVSKYVDNKLGATRMFKWTGPGEPNIIIYNSIGSDQSDWPGPVSADTFLGDHAKFRIKSIRVFKPNA